VRLTPPVAGALIEEASFARQEETCGLLVGERVDDRYEVTGLVPCENVAPPPLRRRRFGIDPRRVIEEERALRDSGRAVVGFYHSHPEGLPVPSGTDRDYMALWPDSVWVILGREGPSPIRAWTLDPGRRGGVIELEVSGVASDAAGGPRRTEPNEERSEAEP
jgi:proteasome lid subunit RPN8/RPN11